MRTGFRPTGLIAILRGLTPAEAVAIGRAVSDAGIGVLEVPLNSPDPCQSISLLRKALPGCLVGAGTVLTTAQVEEAHAAGAQLVVSPNTDVSVITETVRRGLGSYPGAATPSEAFAALSAGARAVKVFPAVQVGPAAMKAWTDVLPAWAELIPVGGIDASSFPAWTAAWRHRVRGRLGPLPARQATRRRGRSRSCPPVSLGAGQDHAYPAARS